MYMVAVPINMSCNIQINTLHWDMTDCLFAKFTNKSFENPKVNRKLSYLLLLLLLFFLLATVSQ